MHRPRRHNSTRTMAELAVTSADRAAFCLEMRKLLLLAILVAATACGAYHFPGSGEGSGTVSGQVTAYPCGGPVQPDSQICMPGASHAGVGAQRGIMFAGALRSSQVVRQGTLDPRPKVRILPREPGSA